MSAAAATAAAAACCSSSNSTRTSSRTQNHHHHSLLSSLSSSLSPLTVHPPLSLNRYESQKRRDWNTFLQYLSHHRPPLTLARCSGAHVLEFLKYLDQFGQTKVHVQSCQFFGQAHAPCPCPCPLKQAWGSLDALIGRLRAAFEENGGRPETNPFAARAVWLNLREVKDSQAKARGQGHAYERQKINYNYNLPQQQEQYY